MIEQVTLSSSYASTIWPSGIAGWPRPPILYISGLRVRKIVNSVAPKYTLHGKNVVHMTRENDNLHFFYDVQNQPAVVVYNGTAYAYVKNLQGDIIAILDNTGTAVVSYTYDAWGEPTGTTGTMKDTLGKLNPFRYRGYVYDEETGLYYLRNRFYHSYTCRFLNTDAFFHYSSKPKSANQFVYCCNNPITNSDVDGTDFQPVGAGIQVDASISAGVGPLNGSASYGIELIVYWDAQITLGGPPIVAVYSYVGGGGGASMSQSEVHQIVEQLTPTIDKLLSAVPDLKKMSPEQITNFFDCSFSASGLLLFGDEGFTSEYSYEKGFVTDTYQVGKIKTFHSESNTCHAVGLGFDFLAKWYSIGYSRSLSNYECIYSSVDGFCFDLDQPRTQRGQ